VKRTGALLEPALAPPQSAEATSHAIGGTCDCLHHLPRASAPVLPRVCHASPDLLFHHTLIWLPPLHWNPPFPRTTVLINPPSVPLLTSITTVNLLWTPQTSTHLWSCATRKPGYSGPGQGAGGRAVTPPCDWSLHRISDL
jgi:hypothetical protein